MSPDISISQLSKIEEFQQIITLQREIWGYAESELLPLRFFIVANKIGGQVLGAFDAGKMAAFCICIPGLKAGRNYLHSHMLGVLPQYRNTGLGRQLKLKQREYAIAEGVDLVEWTFDPLESKNAFFNIERLGAVVRRYVHNQYGTTSSHLHGGLPTDRLVAEWWVTTPRVEAITGGQAYSRSAVEARISVPLSIADLRKNDNEQARVIQTAVARQFDQFFGENLTVVGFETSQNWGTYLLGKWEPK